MKFARWAKAMMPFSLPREAGTVALPLSPQAVPALISPGSISPCSANLPGALRRPRSFSN